MSDKIIRLNDYRIDEKQEFFTDVMNALKSGDISDLIPLDDLPVFNDLNAPSDINAPSDPQNEATDND